MASEEQSLGHPMNYEGDHPIDIVSNFQYLGSVMSADCNSFDEVACRVNKLQGLLILFLLESCGINVDYDNHNFILFDSVTMPSLCMAWSV